MPFNRRGLVHVGAGFWIYRSTDNEAAVTAPGYFTHVPMKVGDQVLRVTFGAGDDISSGAHVVTAVSNFVATVSTR
jgi:hypothetical protein